MQRPLASVRSAAQRAVIARRPRADPGIRAGMAARFYSRWPRRAIPCSWERALAAPRGRAHTWIVWGWSMTPSAPDEIERLVELLPAPLRRPLRHAGLGELVEVVLDLGRRP